MPNTTIRYYGWSALSIETDRGALYFDPFYRSYCGARWFSLEDFSRATVICVTHGHEEHYLDVPGIARHTGAVVVSSPQVCSYLRWRNRLPPRQLRPIGCFEPVEVGGFRITAFKWKHRDINLPRALSKAVFEGNATQLKWAWSSATNAPFYAPYYGFHVTLPGGATVLNYNEGFNTKMTDAEIRDLGARFRTDVLLAGMQLHFIDDLARGAAALRPRVVMLYPPHEKFHEMMGARSAPWSEFEAAARKACPGARVIVAAPGTMLDVDDRELQAA
jgi:L-ascorbate metabolism protein UlaG (beta-lactamase superfamily)